jgi:ABC-type transport system involved in cytochrome bd biosynthesis fused ATPase/permease subunit
MAERPCRLDDALMRLMFIFVVACAAVVGAVIALALADSWWLLPPAIGIHLGATALVIRAIAEHLDDDAAVAS